jgi:hypothetical protein
VFSFVCSVTQSYNQEESLALPEHIQIGVLVADTLGQGKYADQSAQKTILARGSKRRMPKASLPRQTWKYFILMLNFQASKCIVILSCYLNLLTAS